MRALRDFNIPKLVTDDIPIFMGLIGDLFPALDVPRFTLYCLIANVFILIIIRLYLGMKLSVGLLRNNTCYFSKRKRDPEFERNIRRATLQQKLQPEAGFVDKV